jgi:hypothetical protein
MEPQSGLLEIIPGRLGLEQVPNTHSQAPRPIFQLSRLSLIRNILLNAILN